MQSCRSLKDVVLVKTSVYVRILPRPVTGTMEDEDGLSSMERGWQGIEVNQGPSQVA